MKQSRKNKHKRSCGYFCSKECLYEYKKEWFKGENNHQYGLKGKKNATFQDRDLFTHNHNLLDIKVYAPEHPFADRAGRVLKHRLIVEQHSERFDDKYFVVIDGEKYLDKKVEVHHKNFDHNDNRIENLEPLTKGEHISKHNAMREIVRDKRGRIVGIIDHTPRIIKIKPLRDDFNMPKRQHTADAAFDVYSPSDIEINVGRNVVPLGFSIELPKGYAALIRSRSGFSLRGMESLDGKRMDADVITGLVDENFRGEVGAIIKSNEHFVIAKGTRIAQLLPYKVPNLLFEIVDELSETERGAGGYGSTGK